MERDFDFWTRYRKPNTEAAVELYFKICEKHNLNMTQMSIKFCEIQQFMTSVIIGATTMGQLKENVESINIEFTDEMMDRVNEIHNNNPNPSP